MVRNKRGSIWIASCLLLAGIVVGQCVWLIQKVQGPPTDSASIVVEPSFTELPVPVLEGNDVLVHLMFHNRSKISGTLLGVIPSCGCISLLTRAAQNFKPPYMIGPGQSIPVQVRISTNNRAGIQNNEVAFNWVMGDNKYTNIAKISLDVLPGLRVLSSPVVVVNTKRPSSIIIGDAYPDPGIRIESVSSTIPDNIGLKLIDTQDQLAYPENHGSYFNHLKQRYRIEAIALDDTEAVVGEAIITYTVNHVSKELRIPCRVREKHDIGKAFPRSLVIRNISVNKELTRTIHYILGRDSDFEKVVVLESPDFVKTTVRKLEADTWAIEARILFPAVPLEDQTIVVGNERGDILAKIDILFLDLQ